MRPVHKILALAFASAVALPGLAVAADEPPAIQAFLANLERQTAVKPVYDGLTADGSGNVTITNLTLAKAASGDAPGFSMSMGEVAFTGITEEGPALFQVDKASFTNVTLEITGEGGFTASMPQAGVEGWYIRQLSGTPSPQEQFLAASVFPKRADSGRITVIAEGQTLSVDGVEATWEGDPATGAGRYNGKVTNIAIPDALMAVIDPGGVLKQLGYTSLSLDLASTGALTISGGQMGYSLDVGITGRDMGTMKIGASFDEIPAALYAALVEAQASGKEPDLDALMPQIQNVVIGGASLRFEDNSITGKVMPMAAAMQGMDEAAFKASAGPMVQLLLIQLQNEAFAKQAMEAVTAFVTAPKSISLSVRPASPLKVSDLMTMDPNKPGEAITRLGLSVTAND